MSSGVLVLESRVHLESQSAVVHYFTCYFCVRVSFTSFLSSAVASQADSSGDEVAFAQVPFDHPLFIMFSSGTTGKPKCMVHSVGVSRRLLALLQSC